MSLKTDHSSSPDKGLSGAAASDGGRIVLASGSRIRAKLLSDAGVPFEIAPARIDETAIIDAAVAAGRSFEDLAVALAEAKAATGDRFEDAVVIGSDQLLVFGNKAYETPATAAEAIERLKAFAGRPHRLICGYALRRGGRTLASGSRTTTIMMRAATDAEIEAYMARAGDALTSTVGGYEIEGLGLQLIDHMEGDYFSALGLPMFDVMSALRAAGALDTGASRTGASPR